MFVLAWMGDVNSLEEKVSLHGGSFGSQGGTLHCKRGVKVTIVDFVQLTGATNLPIFHMCRIILK